MKQPSVPPEEKWAVGERPPEPASRPGDGAGNGAAWLPNGQGRRPAPVEPTDRQRLAVEAYCRELCTPAEAPVATTEALSAFTVSATRLGRRATSDDHARVLARAMRAAAASHAGIEASSPGWRSRVADALTAERDVGCRSVPGLLACRANGELAGGEAAALRDHLRDCLRCRATEVRMARAERTFATASRLGMMPPGVTGIAFTAATAAAVAPEAPVAPETPAGAPPSPTRRGSRQSRPPPSRRRPPPQRHRRPPPLTTVVASDRSPSRQRSACSPRAASLPPRCSAEAVCTMPRPTRRRRPRVRRHRPRSRPRTHPTMRVSSTTAFTSRSRSTNRSTSRSPPRFR